MNKDIHSYRAASTSEERKDSYLSPGDTSKELRNLFSRFKQKTSSPQFKFWDSYIKMVLLLLRFIRAEREGNWKLQLETTAEMIPHFFSMDRTNYSRWLPVYIMDMYQLEETAPDVHHEFMNGNHWTDMALEQSVNLD